MTLKPVANHEDGEYRIYLQTTRSKSTLLPLYIGKDWFYKYGCGDLLPPALVCMFVARMMHRDRATKRWRRMEADGARDCEGLDFGSSSV
jgi:hypothetical protein